jgi:hypothetical protein
MARRNGRTRNHDLRNHDLLEQPYFVGMLGMHLSMLPSMLPSIDRAGRNGITSCGKGGFMKWWRWTLLIFELFLFALILVLPQVDLPDFTFHGGTAPIVAKSRLSSPPVLSSVTTPLEPRLPQHFREIRNQCFGPAAPPKSNSLHLLLCTLLC